MELNQEAEQLQMVPMFSRLESSKLKLLAFTSELLKFSNGQILFRHNEPSDCAYVIMDGEVEILAPYGDEDTVLLTRGRNELIGEMAVLSGSPRSATLRARGAVQALKIPNEQFLKLLSENPEVALSVMHELSDKLAKSHEQVEELEAELRKHTDAS